MKVLVNNKEVKTGASTLSQLIEELALTDARHCHGRRQPYCTSHGMATKCILREYMPIIIIKAACGG